MGQRKSYSTEPHYYSEGLKGKLNELRFASTAVVEAPSGYGKTTAVRDFLKTGIPENTPVFWFTAMNEPAATGFRRLCYEVNKIDECAGGRLLQIGLPNAATIGEAYEALRAMHCTHETYLVLDNFQFLQTALLPSFLHGLMDHGGEGLHIIIITQMLEWDIHTAIAGRGFLHITASDLRLDAGDIRRYYTLAQVNITPAEAQTVAQYTEGWIIAVYLQLRAFLETGAFSDSAIIPLMEHLVWKAMTKEQQVFLMRCSPFDSVTLQQACTLTGHETLPPYALQALQNPFIRYERGRQQYELHRILTELLQQKRRGQGAAFELDCLLQAGDLCRDEGRSPQALGFYWRIKDYGRMLSVDFPRYIFEEIGNIPFSKIAVDIARNCPPDIKKAYPLAMLRIAWALLACGRLSEFGKLMEELQALIDAPGREDTGTLRGEWLLLSSLNSYPDLDQMAAILKKAALLFKGKCSQVIWPDSLWWFGGFFPLADFHIKPGEADQEAAALEKYVALLAKLTNGYGTGADALYRATLAFLRGNISEAETLAYKAAYLAENKKQIIIQLGAALQLAEVALHKADTEGWQHAIVSMERAAANPLQNNFVLRSYLDIMRGMLLVELQQVDRLADWLKRGDFSENRLLRQMLPLALYIHGKYLLHRGETPRQIGLIEANLAQEAMDRPVYHMLLTLNLASGYLQLNNRDKAIELIRSTAQKAMPDGLVFAFASFSWLLQQLTDDLVEQEYSELYDSFQEIKERFGLGWTKLYNDLSPEELPANLTEREREVALLAAGGLHNNEIAQKLFISESTVRTHLRTVFKKLAIDRRVKLAEKLK